MNYTTTLFKSHLRAISVTIGILILAILYSGLIGLGTTSIENNYTGLLAFFLQNSLPFIGFVLAGLTYLYISNHSLTFIDVSTSVTREMLIKGVLTGIICSLTFILISVISEFLNIPSISVGAELGVENNFNRVLVFMIIVLLFNAPAEEFLYRNIIQKRLLKSFTPTASVFFSSLIFMSVHIPTYIVALQSSTTGSIGMVTPLITIFILGGVLGASYQITKTLWVPIIAHALYNILQLLLFSVSNGLI